MGNRNWELGPLISDFELIFEKTEPKFKIISREQQAVIQSSSINDCFAIARHRFVGVSRQGEAFENFPSSSSHYFTFISICGV
jgi:hypothetical protein